MRKRITISIGGLELGQSLDEKKPIFGVADFVMPWGRQSIFDDVTADVATFTVIDPDGDWSLAASRVGELVVITRNTPTKRIVFRGRITDADPEAIKYRGRYIWKTKVVAVSLYADAMAHRPLGPGYTLNGVAATNGWISNWVVDRLNYLWAYAASKFFTSIPLDVPMPSGLAIRLRGMTASAVPKLMDHLAQIFRINGLGYPKYDPETGALTIGTLGLAGPISLVIANGKINVAAVNSLTLPAGKFAVDGLKLNASIRDAISTIEVLFLKSTTAASTEAYGDTTNSKAVKSVPVSDSASGVLSVETLFYEYHDGSTNFLYYTHASESADTIEPVVESATGYVQLPILEFSENRLTGDTTADSLLLGTTPTSTPVFFAHSFFNGRPAVAQMYHIVGGELRFNKNGWSNRLITSPCGLLNDPTATLATICTNAAYSLTDFDSAVTLGDLATVTIGLN